MSLLEEYLEEITIRNQQGLGAKPIDNGNLAREIITHVKSIDSKNHNQCVDFLIFNMLPGTTKAASEKAEFLKQIINDIYQIDEISTDRAFELLSHMKGGPSIKVLIDLALSTDSINSKKAAEVLKTQVFLYEADTARLISAYRDNNSIAEDILKSYSKAEFFTELPEIEDEIEIVTYVAGEGDISTDLLSPGNQAHSRADRELHGKCFISERAQKEIEELKLKHPDRRIMLVAEKGTMGVGSSRMSGINNVALWTGRQSSPFVPFVNSAPIVAGTNGVSPIFLTTVGVTGGIGVDLKKWVKIIDQNGSNQKVYSNNSAIGDSVAWETEVVGVALDLDNGKIYFHKSGTYINSGDPASGTDNGGQYDLPTAVDDQWLLGVSAYNLATWNINFGGYTSMSISSAETDANGYGTFEYAPPSGYYALCTKNLAEYG